MRFEVQGAWLIVELEVEGEVEVEIAIVIEL
jgi:hypothetical protein